MSQNSIIVVRGGGDLASGVIHRLFRCGYKILILEGKKPKRDPAGGFFLRSCL